eukprot:2078382-Prorocentrum_lima.AAC.1
MHHQPPPPIGPELPGARVAPGQPLHCEPGVDPPLWAWPSGLGDGSGGSLPVSYTHLRAHETR